MSNIEQNKKRPSLDLIIICRANTLIMNYYLTKKICTQETKKDAYYNKHRKKTLTINIVIFLSY